MAKYRGGDLLGHAAINDSFSSALDHGAMLLFSSED